MAKNVKTKAKLERHFTQRWSDRYPDVKMPPIEWIVHQIRNNGKAVQPAGRQSIVRSRFILRVDGVRVPIVYDTKRGTVVTALPRHILNDLRRDTHDGQKIKL